MKDHPILFSAPMITAILNGTKTMTRRIVKNLDLIEDVEDGIPFFADEYGDWHKTETRCPYGFKDDLLYVRETWNLFLNDKGKVGSNPAPVSTNQKEIKWKDQK